MQYPHSLLSEVDPMTSLNCIENFADVFSNQQGLKNWKCRICGQIFGRKDNIQRHMLTHSGYKPFVCPLCPYKATQKGNLKRHLTNVHSNPIKIQNTSI